MTGSRDERQAKDGFRPGGPDGSGHAANETPASSQGRHEHGRHDQNPQGHAQYEHDQPEGGREPRSGQDGPGPEDDAASRVVTTVNPTIVPAGSRNPQPAPESKRMRRALLAAVAVVVVAGLSAGGFAFYGDDEPTNATSTGVDTGPEWNGGQENDAPGSAPPAPSSSTQSDKDGKGGKDGDKGKGDGKKPGRSHSTSPGGKGKPSHDGGQAPAPGSGGGSDGTVLVWNHNSDQCIHVPGGKGRDGTALDINTCADIPSMRWTFRKDGTLRALGLCMDVADGSRENGAVIQLAYCSGNPAQQFVLSEGSDLVNPQADKCVAVRDGDVRAGTPLVLWECSGEDSQKWSPK